MFHPWFQKHYFICAFVFCWKSTEVISRWFRFQKAEKEERLLPSAGREIVMHYVKLYAQSTLMLVYASVYVGVYVPHIGSFIKFVDSMALQSPCPQRVVMKFHFCFGRFSQKWWDISSLHQLLNIFLYNSNSVWLKNIFDCWCAALI